jgi:hypothetical protein
MEAQDEIAVERLGKLKGPTTRGEDIGSRHASRPESRDRGHGSLAAETKPMVAVVSRDGRTSALCPNVPTWVLVFSVTAGRLHLVEKRRIEMRPTDVSNPGWQIERLRAILHALRGCKTMVLSRITAPQRLLIEARGIRVLEASGFVEEALAEVSALEVAAFQPVIQPWPQYRR